MDDTISRGETIEALERAKQNIRHNIERAIGRAICEILDEVENGIKQLPPAELGTNLAQLGTDCISRQQAIDEFYKYPNINWTTLDVIEKINSLPSAQLATDTNVGDKAQLYDKGTTFENGGEIKRWSEDIISRQAVMRAIDEALIGKGCSADGTTMAKLINEYVIKKVPSTEQKRGKWIKSGRWGRVYKCNRCGNYLDFDGVNVGRGSTNFCPNCGAKMEGADDES